MKKALKIIGISLLLILFFRGFLYRQTISYTPIKERKSIPLTNQKIITAIQTEAKNKQLDLSTIAHIARKITNSHLQFTFQKVSNNPNKVAVTGKANCIGYATLFNAIVNHLLQKEGLQNRYQTKHLVGKLDFLGVDLHQFFTDAFYQDHDYNLIEDKSTHRILLIDPSLDDYLKISVQSIH